MKRLSVFARQLIMGFLIIFHFSVSVAAMVACWHLFYRHVGSSFSVRYNILILTGYGIALLFLDRIYSVYNIRFCKLSELVYSQSLAHLFCATGLYGLDVVVFLRFTNPVPILVTLAAQMIFDLLWTVVARKVYFMIHHPRRTVLIYRNENDKSRLVEASKFKKKFDVVAEIKDPTDDIDLLFREISLAEAEAVFVAGVNATLRNAIAKFCIETDIIAYFVPHVGDVVMSGGEHMKAFATPIWRVRRAAPNVFYLAAKRLFDIFASLLGILVLSPAMLVTALAIKLYDRGPVLYKQVRLTKDGRKFYILKFRSMRVDAERDGVARLAAANDDRITPIGKFIRAVRFDELPQLFNILRGEMTIVGPRPERPEIAEQYCEAIPAFALRLQVKAGLTGYAQVYGRYNTEPYEKLEYDLMYINKMSVFQDLSIMLATVKILFQRESTSGIAEGQTTAIENNLAEAKQNGDLAETPAETSAEVPAETPADAADKEKEPELVGK